MSDATSIRMRVSNNAPIRMETSAQIGAINCVTGEFTTGESLGVETINVPYHGNGYPVGVLITLENGVNSEPYESLIARGAIGAYMVLKSIMNVPPDYANGDNDYAQCVKYYKQSSSSDNITIATFKPKCYREDDPDTSAYNNLHIHSATEILIYVRGNFHGFLQNTKYKYVVWYNS